MKMMYCSKCKHDVKVRDSGNRYLCVVCGEWCREPKRSNDDYYNN